MLQINKTVAQLDALSKLHFGILTAAPFQYQTALQDELSLHAPGTNMHALFSYLSTNIQEIIAGQPVALERNIVAVEMLYTKAVSELTFGIPDKKGRNQIVLQLKDKILSIFNYDKFVNTYNCKYAYQLLEDLDINVCLYCNRSYTFYHHSKDGKTRPTFDHFYPRKYYPYLSVSFYNLVPSCYTCNMLKGVEKFSINSHLHPFISGAVGSFNFAIDVKTVDFINGQFDAFTIGNRKPQTGIQGDYDKALGNYQQLKLGELYQKHKDYAADILKKSYVYSNTRIEELLKLSSASGERLFQSKEEVIDLVFGNYLQEKDMGKRVLSKFTKDIVMDLHGKNLIDFID